MDELPAPFVFQEYGARKIASQKHTGAIAVPGSGKTRMVLMGLEKAGIIEFEAFPEGPVLVICSGPARATWRREIPKWISHVHPEDVFIIEGHKVRRYEYWLHAYSAGYGFFICNYAIFRIDEIIETIKWGAIIADEYQKHMRGRKTATFKKYKRLARKVPVSVPMSGSPFRKNPGSLWTLFHTCDPKVFRSYWKWVTMTCNTIMGPFGKEIIGPRNIEALHKIMDRYLAYIPKEVTAIELPKGLRSSFPVEMDEEQEKIYADLVEEMIAELKDVNWTIYAATALSRVLKLRQLLCCPKILHEDLGMGAGYRAISEALETNAHVVIFVPFRPACDYIKEALNEEGYKHVYILRGGVSSDEQDASIEAFRKHKGIMVCTIPYAESFDLETCQLSYFLGYDYSLDTNEQAEGRTQRAISEYEFVTWRYIKYVNTIDEHFLTMLNQEKHDNRLVMQRPQSFINMLKGA